MGRRLRVFVTQRDAPQRHPLLFGRETRARWRHEDGRRWRCDGTAGSICRETAEPRVGSGGWRQPVPCRGRSGAAIDVPLQAGASRPRLQYVVTLGEAPRREGT
jgi:hypothetical protein